jgi:hypothetical protein
MFKFFLDRRQSCGSVCTEDSLRVYAPGLWDRVYGTLAEGEPLACAHSQVGGLNACRLARNERVERSILSPHLFIAETDRCVGTDFPVEGHPSKS